ncbi:MAG: serine/threonine-protein kinase, partial [Isosphaeraceae bacterium]
MNAELKFYRGPSDAAPIEEYIDRVCDEFEAGWAAGQPARIEDLLPRVEPRDRTRLFGELLALELDYRWRAGERPDPSDYRRRFPEFVAEVDARTSMVIARPTDQAMGGDASGRTAVEDAAQTGPGAPMRSGTDDAAGEGGTRGRYTLTTVHMDGGVSRVWLARDGDLGREIALKELLPDSASHPQLWSRFLAEARITGQLQHPGVVPVYELARRPDNHQPFYTMPYFRWPTLAEVIRDCRGGRAKVSSSPDALAGLLEAFIAICNTVGHAHSRGVVHRDLKPQNVVVGEIGQVMVLDWGLARLVNVAEQASPEPPVTTVPRPASDQTVAGQVLGTPAYMAPEQAEG